MLLILHYSTFVEMKFESVKIPADIVNKVRKNKKKTKIPVGAFFAMAAEEKLRRLTAKFPNND